MLVEEGVVAAAGFEVANMGGEEDGDATRLLSWKEVEAQYHAALTEEPRSAWRRHNLKPMCRPHGRAPRHPGPR